MTAIKLPPDPTELIATVRTLQDAVEVFRTMKDRLGLTYKFIDEVSGLSKGHADKVLSRTAQKRLGYDTFAVFCELFAVEARFYVDVDAVKRMEAVWEGRMRPPYSPDCKPGRVSKKLQDMAKPYVMREHLKKANTARNLMLSSEQRSSIASKAAKSRWRKHRRKIRCVAEMKRPATLA